jgi:hypothetical protein
MELPFVDHGGLSPMLNSSSKVVNCGSLEPSVELLVTQRKSLFLTRGRRRKVASVERPEPSIELLIG